MNAISEMSIRDLAFDKKKFVFEADSFGHPTWRWVPAGMPRLTQDMMKCVFFLYGLNPKTGKMGSFPGATGFFVMRHSRVLDRLWHVYAITNAHAINPYSSIRINTEAGSTRIIEHEPTDWLVSKTDDLAIIDVTDDFHFDQEIFYWWDDISWIGELDLLGFEDGSGRASVGDQTIMIGLFADHLGAG
jgi:hypothetical protein